LEEGAEKVGAVLFVFQRCFDGGLQVIDVVSQGVGQLAVLAVAPRRFNGVVVRA
jgi:hypothetical protein